MVLEIRWSDIEAVERFDNQIKSLGKNGVKVMQRGLARSGDMARTQVARALTKQTGLPRKVVVRALKVKRPHYHDLSYTITSQGGDISLKYFKPRETRRGVSAAPFGKRQIFAGTFMKGGRFPNRAGLAFKGHVVKRVGADRFPVEFQKSNVVIPEQMVSGATHEAFQKTVSDVLPRRIEHELGRIMGD